MIPRSVCPAKFRVYLFLIITSVFAVTTWDVYAQPAREKVVVGWIDAPPFYQQQASGQPTGFAAAVMLKIAEYANLDVDFKQYEDAESLFASIRAGDSHIMPAARASGLQGLGVSFSKPIGQAELVVVQRAEAAANTSLDKIIGKQVGFFLRESTPQVERLLKRNNSIELPLSGDAIIKLLTGDIDALIASDAWIAGQLRAAKLDRRIKRIATPLESTDRVVALHPSKAHLLAAVNTAIAELEASGELTELQSIWALKLPIPPTDVLTVGVYHFPPFQVVNGDGTFTGFAVEIMRDLATLADLNLTFRELTQDQWGAGPGAERYDMLPQAGISDDRRQRMDFTQPIDESSLSMFVRTGDDQGFTDLDDLTGLRVVVDPVNLARRLAEQHGGLSLEILDKADDLLPALLDQRADVALFSTERMREIIAEADVSGKIEEINPPFHVTERAPALRFGLGDVREQLDAVIPGYLVSDRYQQLRQTWFGEKVYWTGNRIKLVLIGGGLIALTLAGALVWQRWNQRSREAHYHREEQQKQKLYEQEQTHSRKLQSMVSELERSNRELDNFAYVASHDLKEPLRGIAINADLLLREEVSVSGKQRVERMVELTIRMDQLISDLLFFSRLGRGDQSQEDIDPNDVIKGIERELRETLELTNGTLHIETELPQVHADKTKIKIIFQNLIANALRYNDAENRLVNIGFQNRKEINEMLLQNVFYVQDNGIGIDEKNHKKIFRIFTRLNREKDYGKGTGAGLSFVSRIIEEYGNVPTIESQLGQGTTFYFSLPLAGHNQLDTFTDDRSIAA